MKLNGTNIFIGAYAERKNNHQPDQTTISVSKEKAEEITADIKEAFYSLHLQNRGVKVSISKEDMDFLCSEEGFRKMKQDAADLYIKNVNQQKVIAKDKNPDDLFWNNTGNQWLVFSEMLYNNGFYSEMGDEEVKQFEDTLAYITFGMDCLSKSQYLTGMEFSSIREEYKYFMSDNEAITELESSVAALQCLSDRLLPEEQQGEFNRLIDMYYKHNNEVLSEYNNPIESFNKVIAGMYSDKGSYSHFMEEAAKKPVSEYKYTVMLGMTEKSEQEKETYRQGLQILFEKMKSSGDDTFIWEQIRECFQKYSTDDSDDDGFRNYVYEQAQYLFSHMKNCWSRLYALG